MWKENRPVMNTLYVINTAEHMCLKTCFANLVMRSKYKTRGHLLICTNCVSLVLLADKERCVFMNFYN
jgi:hypothetical protein